MVFGKLPNYCIVFTVNEELLMAFCKLLYLRFYVSSDQQKNIMQQRLYAPFERNFLIKIVVTLIPKDLVTIWLYPFFVLSYEAKTKIIF